MLRAGLVGVTGYTGMELSRILASHPSIRLTAATSRQDAGRRLDAVYPFLQGLPGADVVLMEPEVDALAATWSFSPCRTAWPWKSAQPCMMPV